jgi:hypothetical protein
MRAGSIIRQVCRYLPSIFVVLSGCQHGGLSRPHALELIHPIPFNLNFIGAIGPESSVNQLNAIHKLAGHSFRRRAPVFLSFTPCGQKLAPFSPSLVERPKACTNFPSLLRSPKIDCVQRVGLCRLAGNRIDFDLV